MVLIKKTLNLKKNDFMGSKILAISCVYPKTSAMFPHKMLMHYCQTRRQKIEEIEHIYYLIFSLSWILYYNCMFSSKCIMTNISLSFLSIYSPMYIFKVIINFIYFFTVCFNVCFHRVIYKQFLERCPVPLGHLIINGMFRIIFLTLLEYPMVKHSFSITEMHISFIKI